MARKSKSDLLYTETRLPQQVLGWRRNIGWTQGELERRAGLAHNAISRIEQGEVSPKLETVEKIAVALSISVEQLQFRRPVERLNENTPVYDDRSIDAEISILPKHAQSKAKRLILELLGLLKEK